MSKKVNTNELKEGNYLSETQYYKIENIIGNTVQVTNERGFSFGIEKTIIEEGMYSANQHTEIVKVSRTELIDIFSKVSDTIFTVCFDKQVKPADVASELTKINNGKFASNAEIKKIVKSAYKGEQRILTGYLISTETGFGRSSVIDLEGEKGTNPNHDGRFKQVDHRTLKWLIFKNIKYIVK